MCLSDRHGITKVLFSKVHLFSYSNEDKYLSSGTAIATQVIDGVSFGFAICYDLRFPELFSLMSKDCQVIVVIANWPFERSKQWDALLTARAIENECILVGVNRTGIDGNGVQYKKTSMVVMPNGEKMDPVLVDSEIDIYSIKKSVVNNFRKIFPTVDDKKFGLYSQKYKNYQRDI